MDAERERNVVPTRNGEMRRRIQKLRRHDSEMAALLLALLEYVEVVEDGKRGG